MLVWFFLSVITSSHSFTAKASVSANSEEKGFSEYRQVLVQLPKSDPAYAAQERIFQEDPLGIEQRKLILNRLSKGTSQSTVATFATFATFAKPGFYLVGFDGLVKAYQTVPFSLNDLYRRIDGMSMRRAELAEQGFQPFPHARARIIARYADFDAEGAVWLGLDIRLEPGWHTYWSNPGDSGLAPSVTLANQTDAFTLGELNYPVPKRIDVEHLSTFGYEESVLYRFQLKTAQPKADSVRRPESIKIRFDVSFLVCKVECLPALGSLDLELSGRRQGPTGLAADATALMTGESDRDRLSSGYAELFFQSESQSPRAWPKDVPIKYRWRSTEQVAELWMPKPSIGMDRIEMGRIVDVFPDAAHQHVRFTRPVSLGPNHLQLKAADRFESNAQQFSGLLLLEQGQQQVAYRLPTLNHVEDAGLEGLQPASRQQTQVDSSPQYLRQITLLLMALFGGVILNFMPCVLPILGIKILRFAELAREKRSERVLAISTYIAGILTTFVGLAVALLALRQAGVAVGWGFQLQSPGFVFAMIGLFFAIGCHLMGFWELPALRFGSSKAGNEFNDERSLQGRLAREWFEGMFAVVVASPCTAPFMGAAIGAGLQLPWQQTLLIFLALGLGYSLPFWLCLIRPSLLQLLPKPGQWMVRFKEFLAFPMFATCIWLLWVFAAQVEGEGLLLGCSLLLCLGLAFWLAGFWPRVALFWLLASVSSLFWSLASSQSSMLSSQERLVGEEASPGDARSSVWLDFAAVDLSMLRQQGPVFIDFTAKWCITCQVNKQLVLRTDAAQELFARNKVQLVSADWTAYNPAITQWLERYDRAGVPLYLFFPADLEPAKVLPEILSLDLLRSVLEKGEAG